MSLENTRDIGTAKVVMVGGSGGSGTTDYNNLTNKPQINSVELSGNKSLSDIGIEANPSSTGSTDLAKLKVGGTTYNVPNGTTNYNNLSNKPQINSVTLSGNKSLSDIGIEANPSGTASTDLTKLKVGGTTYNIPSSASSLASLTDTIINSPSNGQTLVFNSVSGKWENQNGANSLDGLTDTFIYSPLDGQLLVYDATHGDWRNLYADYNKLQNHPQINLAELTGNKSFSDLGLKANPSDTASTALSKIKIDGTTYSVNGMPADPLPKANGGTGNADGYIRTGWDGDSGIGTHATIEGYSNKAVSDGCHAEGIETAARGTASHAEGYHTNIAANTNYAHAEGYSTTVNGQGGHAEGYGTTATGRYSHAEGYSNTATGNYSHVGGRNNTAGYANQTVIGKYNSNKSDTLFEVGNGESGSPNNALELYDTGLLKVGAVETASGLLRPVTANPSDTASTALTKLKVGSQTYSISNGGSSSYNDLTDKPQINSVTLSGNKSLSDIGIEANPSSSGSTDLTKLKVGSTTYNIPSGGSGNTKLKTRYSIFYSSWSSSPNSDGYYTYSLTLSPTLDTTVSPDVLIAGSSNASQPTDTHKTMFSYVERCYLSGSSLTLYAKTKPTSTFYIWVEGVAGSGSGSIVGNVIQPNGASGGGATTIDISSNIAETQLVATVINKSAVRYGNVITFVLRGTFANPLPSLPDMDEIFTGFPKPIYSTWFEMVEVDFSAPSLIALTNINQSTGGARVGGGVRANMAGKSFIVSGTYVCAN